MDNQSRNVASRASADVRSFPVEAFVGHRASGWLFARFDISSRELRVRLSFPCFTSRSQQAGAIRSVVVTRRFGDMWWIRFDDTGNRLGNVHVHLIYRRQQIIDELRRCGYHVVGNTGGRASPWRRDRAARPRL